MSNKIENLEHNNIKNNNIIECPIYLEEIDLYKKVKKK